MPAKRVSMRRVREILRLKHECGASDREIARSLSIARSTVAVTLERVAAVGLRWPLPATLTDRVLEAACDRGLDIGARSYNSIQSILKHGLDRRPPHPADINRNGRPSSIGTSGRHQSECPADIIGMRRDNMTTAPTS